MGSRAGALRAAETRAERHEAILRDLPDQLYRDTYARCRARIKARTFVTALDWLHNHSSELALTQSRYMVVPARWHETAGSWAERQAQARVPSSVLRARMDEITARMNLRLYGAPF